VSRVVRDLPGDLPAAVFVVLHLPPRSESRLPQVLQAAGPLPASHARDGETPRPGHIYVAPPDHHLIVSNGRLALIQGPRENNVRPSVDPLFRSAADVYGAGLVGVILSGSLDDGTAGLASIAAAGGTTIVQDPHDALVAGMPRNAIDQVDVDHIAPADQIAGLIVKALRQPGKRPRRKTGPAPVGEHLDLICPECGGVLRHQDEAGVARFVCRVGHAFSPDTLYGAQEAKLESALWTAIRSLEESASLARRLAIQARDRGSFALAQRFEDREQDAAERADLVRSALLAFTELQALPEVAQAKGEGSDDAPVEEDQPVGQRADGDDAEGAA
jgi:two-component system chemotaxis response regulator CheB